MDATALLLHAKTVRSVLVLLGPRSRRRLVVMLQGLGLSDAEAEEVLGHAVACELVETDPADTSAMRATQTSP
jgi:hypothetical protein